MFGLCKVCVWGFPFSSFVVLGKSLMYSAFILLRCFFIEMFALKVEVEDKCWKTRVLDFEWFLHSWYQQDITGFKKSTNEVFITEITPVKISVLHFIILTLNQHVEEEREITVLVLFPGSPVRCGKYLTIDVGVGL